MIEVTLDWAELSMAAHVGNLRHIESMRAINERPDGTIPTWDEDIEGAAAELAVAKHMHVPWSGSVNAFCEADVEHLGVRQTDRHDGCLILRKRDLDRYGLSATFVLVTGRRGSYRIRGFTSIGEAKDHPEWWRNPRNLGGAYFVPAAGLHPAEELIEQLQS